MIIVKSAVNFHGLYTRNTPHILKAAHNKSPARLSEAYLCTAYFLGDYCYLNQAIVAEEWHVVKEDCSGLFNPSGIPDYYNELLGISIVV